MKQKIFVTEVLFLIYIKSLKMDSIYAIKYFYFKILAILSCPTHEDHIIEPSNDQNIDIDGM